MTEQATSPVRDTRDGADHPGSACSFGAEMLVLSDASASSGNQGADVDFGSCIFNDQTRSTTASFSSPTSASRREKSTSDRIIQLPNELTPSDQASHSSVPPAAHQKTEKMARKMPARDVIVKLIVGAGQASPSPPVGPALGSKGVKSMDFCKVRCPCMSREDEKEANLYIRSSMLARLTSTLEPPYLLG